MNRLETPLGPDARAVKAGTGPAGKDQLKRLGDRSERGVAFGALLKALDPKQPEDKAAAGEKKAKPEAAERSEGKAKTVKDLLMATAEPTRVDAVQPAPDAAVSASPIDAAAARLLGALQPDAAKAPDMSQDTDAASGAQAQGRAGGLSQVLSDMTRSFSQEAHAGSFAKSAHSASAQPAAQEPGGIALPSQGKTPSPDLSLLTRLADALKDSAAAKEPAAPKDAAADAASLLGQLQGDDGGEAAQPARGPEATAAPLTIAVTHQETHLPPVMKLSPFQQVIEPIRQAAAELVASSRTADAIPELDSAGPAEISSPTKLLHLELRPVELGTITVKLRLSQGGMEMRIEASRAETATMLGQDKEALREIIRASGYSPDTVSVETVHVDAAPGDWQRAQHRQDAPQSPTPDGRDGGRGFNEFRQGEQGREAPRQGRLPDASPSKDDAHDTAETARPGSDPHLYL